MNIPILTVHTIPDGYEPIGLIHAMSVHAVNIVRNIFSGITSIVGGKQGLLESVYNETLNEALNNLKIEGQKVNADLIVGLDIDISSDEQFYVFFCTATALRKSLKVGIILVEKVVRNKLNIFIIAIITYYV